MFYMMRQKIGDLFSKRSLSSYNPAIQILGNSYLFPQNLNQLCCVKRVGSQTGWNKYLLPSTFPAVRTGK